MKTVYVPALSTKGKKKSFENKSFDLHILNVLQFSLVSTILQSVVQTFLV